MDFYLDIFYEFLHLSIIVINLFFWIPKHTRKLHFYIINLTAFSWLILGLKFGLGYCFLTDWHWIVKQRLGEIDLPNSYISYGLEKFFSITISQAKVDFATGACFAFCFITAWVLKLKK